MIIKNPDNCGFSASGPDFGHFWQFQLTYEKYPQFSIFNQTHWDCPEKNELTLTTEAVPIGINKEKQPFLPFAENKKNRLKICGPFTLFVSGGKGENGLIRAQPAPGMTQPKASDFL